MGEVFDRFFMKVVAGCMVVGMLFQWSIVFSPTIFVVWTVWNASDTIPVVPISIRLFLCGVTAMPAGFINAGLGHFFMEVIWPAIVSSYNKSNKSLRSMSPERLAVLHMVRDAARFFTQISPTIAFALYTIHSLIDVDWHDSIKLLFLIVGSGIVFVINAWLLLKLEAVHTTYVQAIKRHSNESPTKTSDS